MKDEPESSGGKFMMAKLNFKFLTFVLFLLLTVCMNSPAVQAKTTPVTSKTKIPNEIHISTSRNSFDGKSGEIDGIFYFENNINVDLEAGATRHVGDTLEDKSSSEFLFGLGSDPSQTFSGGLQYQFWGLQDFLLTNTVKLPFRIKFPNSGWQIQFTPGYSQIQLPDIVGPLHTYKIESEDYSYFTGIQYETPEDWIIRINYGWHDYEKDFTKLSTNLAIKAFTDDTLSLADQLENYRGTTSVTRKFDSFDLGLQYFFSEYAVDKSKTTGFGILLDYYIDDHWKFDSQISRSRIKEGLRTLTDDEKNPYTDIAIGVSYQFN